MLANTQYSYLDKRLLSDVIDYLIMLVLIFVGLLGVVNIIGYQSLMQTGWTVPIYWLAQPIVLLCGGLSESSSKPLLVATLPFTIELIYYFISGAFFKASLGQY